MYAFDKRYLCGELILRFLGSVAVGGLLPLLSLDMPKDDASCLHNLKYPPSSCFSPLEAYLQHLQPKASISNPGSQLVCKPWDSHSQNLWLQTTAAKISNAFAYEGGPSSKFQVRHSIGLSWTLEPVQACTHVHVLGRHNRVASYNWRVASLNCEDWPARFILDELNLINWALTTSSGYFLFKLRFWNEVHVWTWIWRFWWEIDIFED